MDTTTLRDFRIVAIDPADGLGIIECGVKADSPEMARLEYLAGRFSFPRYLDPRDEPFFDVSPDEYILCAEPFDA